MCLVNTGEACGEGAPCHGGAFCEVLGNSKCVDCIAPCMTCDAVGDSACLSCDSKTHQYGSATKRCEPIV